MATHFKFENADAIKALINELPITAMQACSAEMKKIGRDVVKRAQDDHRFHTQSGDLERSMKSKVIDGMAGGKQSVALDIWADLGVAPYARRIHYGWGTWMPDRYLGDAYWEMAKGYNGLSMGERIEKAILKAFSKLKGAS